MYKTKSRNNGEDNLFSNQKRKYGQIQEIGKLYLNKRIHLLFNKSLLFINKFKKCISIFDFNYISGKKLNELNLPINVQKCN